jgi:hypothetical protein
MTFCLKPKVTYDICKTGGEGFRHGEKRSTMKEIVASRLQIKRICRQVARIVQLDVDLKKLPEIQRDTCGDRHFVHRRSQRAVGAIVHGEWIQVAGINNSRDFHEGCAGL